MPPSITVLAVFAMLGVCVPGQAQVPARQIRSPQVALWESAVAGDTVAMGAALRDGARLDSLDTRTNPNGRRALNWAAWFNRVAAIRFLLAHGADLEARNLTGFTALHHAAEAGSLEAAEALLAAGADPNAANTDGRRPAETALAKGHAVVALLLEGKSGRAPAR
ncbi:MAG TPA: ankyrin repeat domain-containing protein [Gemmatimonadales bacterium]